VVVGVPGQVVRRAKPHLATDAPDLNHTALPDTIGTALTTLMARVDALEERLNGHESILPHPAVPKEGAWRGEDFAI
jgi:hypothetical protein